MKLYRLDLEATMDNLFEKIRKANEQMPTIELNKHQYVQVKDRIVAFRSIFPNGKIKTYSSFTDDYVLFEAEIYDDENNLLANAHARGLLNREKAIEKTESASVGRALAFLGLGTSESIASYEEKQDVETSEGIFDEDVNEKKKLVEEFDKMPMAKRVEILNALNVKKSGELKVETLKSVLGK